MSANFACAKTKKIQGKKRNSENEKCYEEVQLIAACAKDNESL
jgi:hypothetical protein